MLKEKQNYQFEHTELLNIKECLQEHGFAIVKKVLSKEMTESLKTATLREASKSSINKSWQSHTCLNFMEKAPEAIAILNNKRYMNLVEYLHGTKELCFHRSACIAREKGNAVVSWHTDQSQMKDNEIPNNVNHVLNDSSFDYDGFSAWFYLTGSRPSHGGIYVIEGSHKPSWKLPEGFQFTGRKKSFCRIGEPEEPYKKFDIPGAIPVIADPGDMILFTKNTYHAANANTEEEIRLSCAALGFRPKHIKIDAPWDWPKSAHEFKANLDLKYHQYLEGYPSIIPNWKPED